MTTERPRLITSETLAELPILIIDKNGIIGESLAEELKDQFQIVLLTTREINKHENISLIHYGKKIPMLPDHNYSEIFIIYHGEKTTLDMLSPVLKKASEINAGLTFITSIYYTNKKLQTILSGFKHEKIKQIIYGEVFGKDELEQNSFTEYIYQIRLARKLEIPGSGLHKIYPILFDDIRDAVITSTFALKHKGILLVMPPHGFTHLAMARAFQKIDSEIKVNFIKQKHPEIDYTFPPHSQYYFQKYDLADKLKNIDLTPFKAPTGHQAKNARAKKPKFRRPRSERPYGKFRWLIICVLFFIIPLLLQFVLLIGGSFFLSESLKTSQNNNLALARQYNHISSASFLVSGFISENISFINPVLYFQKDPLAQSARTGKSLAEIEADFLDSLTLVKSIYEGKSTNPEKDFRQVIAKTKNSLISWQKLKAENLLPRQVSDRLKPLEEPLALLGASIDTLPDLLGFNQKKKYLILFQNNMELRPGGGFIGSFATVEIKDGVTGKLEIRDVYDADGKLSTHVEPPFALRRYLGAPHLFLRDSNFNVDFVVNARNALKFLELETGEKADGVIAIDTSFVKSLVAVFGPLQLIDFKETVTADNFYLLTQTHAEKDFFPGSTQKKDFLRAVYNALESKIMQDKDVPVSLLAQKVSEAIKKKQMLIALPDTEAQKLYSVNNLSGTLQDNRDLEDNKILDYFGINEANLGMNKSNFYLKRSIEQKVTIDGEGSVSEKINITYENTSDKDSVFGGDYKNYLRVILPEKAVLQSVEVNDIQIPTTPAVTEVSEFTRPGFIPPPELEVEIASQSGKTIYGFLTIIPMRSSEKISVSYRLTEAFDINKAVFAYDLYLFKQPGTGDDPYSLSVSYPGNFSPIQGDDKFTNVGGKLLYSDKLSEDKNISLKFSKK